jgi:polysaccharide pyruvyl transferase WcaK-like protein
MLRWGLAGTALFVRDQPSAVIASQLGLRAELVPDLAFRSPRLRDVASRYAGRDHPSEPILGWAPRSYRQEHRLIGDPEAVEAALVDAVAFLMDARLGEVRLFAHVRASETDDDGLAVARVQRRLAERRGRADGVGVAPRPSSLAEGAEQYAQVSVLITSRMHAAIFAMAVGVPSLVVGYEPKVAGVMKLLGLDDWVVPTSSPVSWRELVDRIERLLDPSQRARARSAWQAAQLGFERFDETLIRALNA